MNETSYLQDRRGDVSGLPEGPVTAVAVDAAGRVWAGTPTGLYAGRVENYSVDFSPVPILREPVEHLLAEPDGIWVATGESLQLLSTADSAHEIGRSHSLPAPATRLASLHDTLWVVTSRGLLRIGEGGTETVRMPEEVSARSLAGLPDGRNVLAAEQGLWVRDAGEWNPVEWEATKFVGERGLYPFAPSPDLYDLRSDSHGHLWIATGEGVVLWGGGEFWEHFLPSDSLPMSEVRSLLLAPDGSRWFAHPRGLSRLRDGEWRYFAGRRWLPHDTVMGLAPDGRGGVFAATPGGLGWVAAELMTLEEKARRFEERLRTRHVRHGYVSTSILETPGDFSTSVHEASDNDGLWTSLYVAAQCFRYQATRDPVAKANAIESMAAMERLELVTPIPGFPARALVLDGERVHKSDPETGEWHPFTVQSSKIKVQGEASEEPALNFEPGTLNLSGEWKGDTSSDELVGHFFACAVFWDTMEDEEWKGRAAAYAGRIADHLIENDFNLIDLDGKHTRWGFYSPRILNAPEGEHQRGLNSLEILQHLKVAHTLTGEERFREAYLHLVHDHHYALNTLRQKITVPGHVNHSDDELAFLSYYPLLKYETDPDLLAIYRKSFRRSWEIERPERSPFLNFLYGAAMPGPCDAEESRRALEEIPLDIVHWTMENSHREDLPLDETEDRFTRPQSRVALRPGERGMLKWNANPYRLDDGSGGRVEEDGAFFLLPYWMGRAYGFVGKS